MRSILRKSKSAIGVLRREGLIGFLIIVLQKIKAKSSTAQGVQKAQIHTKARYVDILAYKGMPIRSKSRKVSKNTQLHLAWVMPPPGKGSGGHLNIFRFIQYAEEAGMKCSIYIYVDSRPIPSDAIRLTMGDSYPAVDALKRMRWLDSAKPFDPDVDVIIATSWETAYGSYAIKSTAYRAYFVQDFEPYFYPVGGMYTLAENTYKMGFYGITAGNWLKHKLQKDYGMETASFNFGCDPEVYRFSNTKERNEIFCYVRPYTERRGFEIAIAALDIFNKENPDYTINLVGWDVSNYDIPFPHNNLKTLEVEDLSDLYNRCIAGLVLSYTNMSLLPLELLGCGTIPVVNDAPNNRKVSNNQYIAYAANNPSELANKLSEVVRRKNSAKYARDAAVSVRTSSWDQEGAKFVKIIQNLTR